MDLEAARKLREPFAPDEIGKRPQLICVPCHRSKNKVCDQHEKAYCEDCGNWVSSAHMHLDFTGHAIVTDRLLAVDPEWTWEPMARNPAGLPVLDGSGGLWILLTILDVTRPGYGHADGRVGGDAMKEIIGDALRNASMRFGVGLDLWRPEHRAVRPVTEAPAPAQKDTAEYRQVVGEVKSLGALLDWDMDQLGADYARRYDGHALTDASFARLVDYRGALQAELGAKP